MPHHLTVRINHATHPFLAGAEVFVTDARNPSEFAPTSPQHEHAPHGEWAFDLPDAMTEVSVELSTSFTRGDRQAEWLFRQGYRVGDAALAPVASAAQSARHRPFEARTVRRSAGGSHHLDIDLSFLDVTELVRVRGARLRASYDGCEVRIYQYTGLEAGARATVVGVVIPPGMRVPRDRADVLTFFCPAQGAYRDAFDADAFQLARYVVSPADADYPGFLRRDQSGGLQWVYYPPCSFARQLADSRRAVLLMVPFANGASYGPWKSAELTSSPRDGTPPSLLARLLRALQADGAIGGAQPPSRVITPGRVGLAGFSLGGARCLEAFERNHARVAELYLFDPNDFGEHSPHHARVAAWTRAREHRLRLVGGMHLPELLDYARGTLGLALDGSHDRRPEPLSTDPSAMMLPTSRLFWHRSVDYSRAYLGPESPWLTLQTATRPGLVSAATGVHLAALAPRADETELPLHVELANGETLDATAGHFAAPELGFVMSKEVATSARYRELSAQLRTASRGTERYEELRQRRNDLDTGWPVWTTDRATSSADFRERIDHLQRLPPGQHEGIPAPSSLRHQWVVCGGQSADGTAATFKGYLQICLETSGFTRS